MIDVLIPARNEANTIRGVVMSLLRCPEVGRVVVVVNGSDYYGTAIIAAQAGATVLESAVTGKGQAVAVGLDAIDTDRVLLCDGDLSPIYPEYVDRLTRDRARRVMVIGVPDFTPNAPWARPGALWNRLSGVRALPTDVLLDLRDDGRLFGYTLEVMINELTHFQGIPTLMVHMRGVRGIPRWGQERKNAMKIDKEWLEARGYTYGQTGIVQL